LRALVRLLRQAGVDFAVLGPEERDTGDLARRHRVASAEGRVLVAQGVERVRIGGDDAAEIAGGQGLLRQAGVDFAVLGPEERDTGDLARRLGDEATFQALAARVAMLALARAWKVASSPRRRARSPVSRSSGPSPPIRTRSTPCATSTRPSADATR
jgi:hypothetical protein